MKKNENSVIAFYGVIAFSEKGVAMFEILFHQPIITKSLSIILLVLPIAMYIADRIGDNNMNHKLLISLEIAGLLNILYLLLKETISKDGFLTLESPLIDYFAVVMTLSSLIFITKASNSFIRIFISRVFEKIKDLEQNNNQADEEKKTKDKQMNDPKNEE